MKTQKLERIFKIDPAFDKRDPDPKKNYGVHGCTMRFALKGKEGAVQFTVYTNWHLPHITKETDARILARAKLGATSDVVSTIRHVKFSGSGQVGLEAFKGLMSILETAKRSMGLGEPRLGLDEIDLRINYHPMAADLGYHSPVPRYEDHTPIGGTHVDLDAMTRNLEKIKDAEKLGIEPEGLEEACLPTGVADPCDLLDGKPCYYDGSSLSAQPVFERMLKEGSDGVWASLEEYYKEVFLNESNKGS